MLEFLAQSSSSGSRGGNPLSLLVLVAPVAIFYFLLIRPQRRRAQQQQAVLSMLEVGDEVMTTGGIFGTITEMNEDEDTLELEIAPGTKIRILRAGVSRKLVEDEEEYEEEEEADDEEADESS